MEYKLPTPGVQIGSLQPQSDVLATRRCALLNGIEQSEFATASLFFMWDNIGIDFDKLEICFGVFPALRNWDR